MTIAAISNIYGLHRRIHNFPEVSKIIHTFYIINLKEELQVVDPLN